MPRGGVEKPLGYEVVWKDRPGRTRIKVKVATNTFVDKRKLEYLKYHPGEDLTGYVIIHLDNNPFNFDKENLVKVSKKIHMFMLHHKLYFDNAELTKTGIKLAELKCALKEQREILERVNEE